MKKQLNLLALGTCIAISSLGYSQTTRYVAPTGNDVANDCSSPGNPCSTIQAALFQAVNGDTIKLAPGQYNNSSSISISKSIILTALDADDKPVLTTTASVLMSIAAPEVEVSNLRLELGLASTTGMTGIEAVSNFDMIKILNNEIVSTEAIVSPGTQEYVWQAFAIKLSSEPSITYSATIRGNQIGVDTTKKAFGRGIYLGIGGADLNAPEGSIENNEVVALYALQAARVYGDLLINNNDFKGITHFHAVDDAAVTITNNVFSGNSQLTPAAHYTLVEFREVNTGVVNFLNNHVEDYETIGLLSSASKNVLIANNVFSPVAEAADFISIMANTKYMTSGGQNSTYPNAISLVGNLFNAGAMNGGTAVVFADHYGMTIPAFDNVVIGGAFADEKNIFNNQLGKYISLDDQVGPSDTYPLWAGYGVTTMKPFAVDIEAFKANNEYNVTSTVELEGKMDHKVDNAELGLITYNDGLGNRYVATTGIDEFNDCTNESMPCKTIFQAITVANSSDTVFVAGGTYAESTILSISQDSLYVTAYSTTTKPVITTNQSTFFDVNANAVTIKGLELQFGLSTTSGMIGIESTTNTFNGLVLNDNDFVSIAPITAEGMEWNAFAVRLYSQIDALDTVTITNNNIRTSTIANNVFGRGITIGSGTNDGASGVITDNSIIAFYGLQLVRTSGELEVTNNTITGITMVNAPKTDVSITITNNEFDLVNALYAQNFYAQLDVRAIELGAVAVTNNTFKNYTNIALFSNASKNVLVQDNSFQPLATAANFVSIMANSKLMTAGVQGTTYPNEITILGNDFQAGATNGGTAILFADHYGVTSPAFDNVVIGGAEEAEKNEFSNTLGNYIVLDDKSGPSSDESLWSSYAVTTMKPFETSITALYVHNIYNYDLIPEVEAKNIDSLDNPILGKIILGESPLSIVNLTSNNFELFPNPAVEQVTIVLQDGVDQAAITIMDVAGKTIFNSAINGQLTINVSSLQAGVYFATVEYNGKLSSTKFVKH